MKKIISLIATAALALGFVSCSGDLHDDSQLQMNLIIGDMKNEGVPMTSVEGNVSKYSFTYDSSWDAWGGGAGKLNFKVLKVWDNWATAGWGPDSTTNLTVNGDAVKGKQGGGQGNFCAIGLVNGKDYTIIATTSGSDVSVSLTGYVKPDPVAADLSAINATTMAQPNAYIEIKGDAWKDATVGKYFFNKKGDSYVAVIPFTIASDVENGWGRTDYAAWGKIGVGDNDTVKAEDKQFNFASGKLNFDGTENIIFSEIVPGKSGIITVTASASDCTVVCTLN